MVFKASGNVYAPEAPPKSKITPVSGKYFFNFRINTDSRINSHYDTMISEL